MRMTHEAAEITDSIAAGCTAWRNGDDAQGKEHFQRACLLWLETLDDVQRPGPADDTEFVSETAWLTPPAATEVTRLLKQVLQSLHSRDIIHATDTLEYKILPLLIAEAEDSDESTGGLKQ
ncbi:hypothetical protein [Alicyclobacillus sp. SO9]|uniref:hypothetical protein n=1 Tax=Alicyclobacillus sp. SO9 TaxID=2665646 RepID=UPI0018E7FB6F|nr:hypothetical protein [Alicyclobacillus sp. SO9]QQE78254.1 hypothetical protein GI364_20610 [Alicyclobacillus sp. SO9]